MAERKQSKSTEPAHVSGLTLKGETSDSMAHRLGRYNVQVCAGAYDPPLEDFLYRTLRPHGLTWTENVMDGVVTLEDGSNVLFTANTYPANPRGTCYEPDILLRPPGEGLTHRVPLHRGTYRIGNIGNGVLEGDEVSYSKAAGVQMPIMGSDKFEYRIGPKELVFRQGDVIDVRCPKLGLTWEYYVPVAPYYCQESFWEAHGTILGKKIVYGWVYVGGYWTNIGSTLWEAYSAFAGFRDGKWSADYCLCFGLNTYDNGEREILLFNTGLDDFHFVGVQTSPAPGKPFTLTTMARDVKFSASRRKDGSKQVLYSTSQGDWEFVMTAKDSPDSQWSWGTGRRVGDTRKLTKSAGWVDHILLSLDELKGGLGSVNIFGIPAAQFRSEKGHAPA